MPSDREYVVTVAPNRPVADVAAALSGEGFKVADMLDEIGLITGRCAESAVPRLLRLPGVAAVEPSSEIDIGPPDRPTTW